MKVFKHNPEDPVKPNNVIFKCHAGYMITTAAALQAAYYSTAQSVVVSGVDIEEINAGLTLDQAHAALTDSLTKAELVEVGADLGLSLNALSLKAELLADIRAHLEGLANG